MVAVVAAIAAIAEIAAAGTRPTASASRCCHQTPFVACIEQIASEALLFRNETIEKGFFCAREKNRTHELVDSGSQRRELCHEKICLRSVPTHSPRHIFPLLDNLSIN